MCTSKKRQTQYVPYMAHYSFKGYMQLSFYKRQQEVFLPTFVPNNI